MNQEKQPEALRLASALENIQRWLDLTDEECESAAAELRRLHALAESQRAELAAEAARTAEEKLRADQMTEQHRMQCDISKSAVATLVGLGYTDRGGEQWAPPIGKAPDFNLLDAANAQIAELQAQLSAIGAGGVESLRKREQFIENGVSEVLTSEKIAEIHAEYGCDSEDPEEFARAVESAVLSYATFPEQEHATQLAGFEPTAHFGLAVEQIDKLRTSGLKPEEIAGEDPGAQLNRVRELVWWFARFADGHANPKWLRGHAFELAYYIACMDVKRGVDLKQIRDAAYKEGAMISPAERGMLERIGFIPAAPAPTQDDARDALTQAALEEYEAFFSDAFAQACSNGLFDAWGKNIDCTRLNEAHQLASKALAAPAQEDALSRAVREVLAEIHRAQRKFPTWPTDPLHALAVLGEEFGELTKDVLQLTYEPGKTTAENMATEARQTAAMALRFYVSLPFYQLSPGVQHDPVKLAAARAAQGGA